MRIQFEVHHMYGLAGKEIFTPEQLGINEQDYQPFTKENEALRNTIKPIFYEWVQKTYSSHDTIPKWTILD